MKFMTRFFFRFWRFFRFYSKAVTKYQLHSPFVFELAKVVLDDPRWYYAFSQVEKIRSSMLESPAMLQVLDFGTGANRYTALSALVRRSASSAGQGRSLFRLANWANPRTMLELGTSVGIGAMYLASGARQATLMTLEGSPEIARLARENLELLGLGTGVDVVEGKFTDTLPAVLEKLQALDVVYFDGHHRQAPTLAYFEQCLAFSHEKTVFVFDDVHWSAEMEAAWALIQQHPRVTLTVDFFDLSLAFIHTDIKQKQHWNIVPAHWKIWKFY